MTNRWPRADGSSVLSARCKTCPDDFKVSEILSFEPDGHGEHLYLKLEKSNLTSLEAAGLLARLHGVRRDDIGLAGMKDKRAVTRQWFSVPGVEQPAAELTDSLGASGLKILAVSRHPKKLRRGQLNGNSFCLRLRNLSAEGGENALQALARQGAPNYFGAQRFGRDNVAAATQWLEVRRRRRVSAFRKGLHLSVLRSFLFNEVLAARVAAGNWRELIAGDVAANGMPTGPLWGRGRSAASGAAARIEESALSAYEQICDGLEHAGVSQQRRALVLMPEQMSWQLESPTQLRVAFTLPAGGYATSLLAQAFDLMMVDHDE